MIDLNVRQLASYISHLEGTVIDLLGENPSESAIANIKFSAYFPSNNKGEFLWIVVVGDRYIQVNTKAYLYKDLKVSEDEFCKNVEKVLKENIRERLERKSNE
jgi:hypothetical protein